ncbi:DUF2164 domain-containing protein [Clostridium hydrogenum]|uniref:DUF2164 domain-containing protein n=1 Tax=Clostridium hydrogenum TaxID=2855764 RepID=UPI002E31DBA2|nr:DUF2164 domain-containing protein [Clostridium hydrogenum]
MYDKFELNKEKRNSMINSIREYFQNERDEEMGELAAGLILDFFMEELASEFYNQGVQDAYKYMSDRLEDVFEIEK